MSMRYHQYILHELEARKEERQRLRARAEERKRRPMPAVTPVTPAPVELPKRRKESAEIWENDWKMRVDHIKDMYRYVYRIMYIYISIICVISAPS